MSVSGGAGPMVYINLPFAINLQIGFCRTIYQIKIFLFLFTVLVQLVDRVIYGCLRLGGKWIEEIIFFWFLFLFSLFG